MTNPHKCRVAIQNGKFAQVPCCWTNGVLAVTTRVHGHEDGVDLGPGWTVTHVPTGWSIGSLLGDAFDVSDHMATIRFAEHMADVVPWATVTPEMVRVDAGLRRKVREAATAFHARDRGEG